MSSKRFKGKLCVYCRKAEAAVGDHVLAREFFRVRHRANLPQVPACDPCNTRKGRLEHYLTAVLPFGGRHITAQEELTEAVPPRLERNQALRRALNEGWNRVWSQENGVLVKTSAVPINPTALPDLFSLVALGLTWHHWNVHLPADCSAVTLCPTLAGSAVLETRFFKLPLVTRVSASLGDGTIAYEGLRDSAQPQYTAWRFVVYGGLKLADESTGETSTEIVSLTGVRSFIIPALKRWGFDTSET